MDKKIQKMAQKDAETWLAAEMAYGEGAGTKRKLAQAEIDSKYNLPGWYEAFCQAYDALDKNEFAKAAIKERKAADRAMKIRRNVRAVSTGNLNNLTTGVFLIAGGVIIARKTGYDKVIEREARKGYARAKEAVTNYRVTRQARDAKAKLRAVADAEETETEKSE